MYQHQMVMQMPKHLELMYIETWEIELLDNYNVHVKTILQSTMMQIKHPTKSKFNLFHSINFHQVEKCDVLTVLKICQITLLMQ